MTDQAAVAKNLRHIEDMAARLEARAIDRGADKDMPGGAAMVALAGVASRDHWMRRIDLAEADGDYDKGADEDPDKLWPALQTLWYWSEDYRTRLGHDYDDPRWRPTLASEARFLRNGDVADWIWDHEDHYDNYAKDVERARTKLENILMEGIRSERTGVVCDNPVCEKPRTLIRVYADRQPIEWECAGCGDASSNPDPCQACGCDELVECRWESDAADDTWKCGSCRRRYTNEDVQKMHAKQMRSQGAERWVSTTAAVQLMRDQGWQDRVIRGWFDDRAGAEIEMQMRDGGQRAVWWPSLWRHHLLQRQEREIARRKAADRERRKATCLSDHPRDCWVAGRGCSVGTPLRRVG